MPKPRFCATSGIRCLALIDELAKGPKCVTDMQDLWQVRQANISQHLAVLRQ